MESLKVSVQLVFGERSKANALHREATVLKKAGDWDGAVAKLIEAKEIMLSDNFAHTTDMWCRLAKFLQYAGRYEESLSEFDFLLNDLKRVKNAEYSIDDPAVSFGKDSKKMLAYRSMLAARSIIKREREVVIAREARKKLKKKP